MPRPSPQTDRVVALIEALGAQPDRPLSLADVTRRLGVNKSTCHSMLAALHDAGWLLRDPTRKTYRLGPALVGIGRAAAAGFPALEYARPLLDACRSDLGLHCAALAPTGDGLTVVEQAVHPDAGPVALQVGAVYPLRPPFGSVAVAHAAPAAVDAWLASLPDAAHERYRRALAVIRRRGYAVETSAPALERLRTAIDAVTAEGAVLDATDGSMQELVERLARELAARDDYLAEKVRAGEAYRVNAVNAAALDGAGHCALVLSLTGFAELTPGREVAAAGERLAAAAATLTLALAPGRAFDVASPPA